MVKTDAWTQAVPHQLDLGRLLLPLGGPSGGTWITEQAAVRSSGSRPQIPRGLDGVSVHRV